MSLGIHILSFRQEIVNLLIEQLWVRYLCPQLSQVAQRDPQDGTWCELRRNLDADLRSVFGVGVKYVLWFCIRGDYDLDDLALLGAPNVAFGVWH